MSPLNNQHPRLHGWLLASLAAALLTINGGHAPIIRMRSGEWQRWQMVYAGAARCAGPMGWPQNPVCMPCLCA
jgi:hypothetical protein